MVDTKNFIKREEKLVLKARKTYAQKHPIVFALGGSFGLVATFYGFEKLIDSIDLFNNNPWIILGTGLALLLLTGAFYNKLG